MYGKKKVKQRTPDEAYSTLEWLCSKMERCSYDARRSLYRWGITEREDQDRIISRLVDSRFIDDDRYASAYVRDKLISGRWGISKIRMGLRAKMLDGEVIERAIEENVDRDSLSEKLLLELRKHYQKEIHSGTEGYKLRERLFRRAVSRGFEVDEVNNAINIVFDEHKFNTD